MKTQRVPGGVLVTAADGRQRFLPAARVAGGVWLSLDGEAVFIPDAEEGANGRRPETAALEPVSPMPGRVVKVFAKDGAVLKSGDPLVAVEAMKMEYLVRAPANGKVVKVLCAAGQTVALGEKLVDWKATP